MHTTNYTNAFIEIADDCPIQAAEIPPQKGEGKTIAGIQFELIYQNPYKFTSDDVVFQVFSIKNELSGSAIKTGRETFFSKGQPCLRSSPLAKRYGWGIHFNDAGKIAIFPVDSKEYGLLQNDTSIKHLKAMRTSRK
jgi:hypothetical protein